VLRELVRGVETWAGLMEVIRGGGVPVDDQALSEVKTRVADVGCRAHLICDGPDDTERPMGWSGGLLVLEFPDGRTLACEVGRILGQPKRLAGNTPALRAHNRWRRERSAHRAGLFVPIAADQRRTEEWRTVHAFAIGIAALGSPPRATEEARVLWERVRAVPDPSESGASIRSTIECCRRWMAEAEELNRLALGVRETLVKECLDLAVALRLPMTMSDRLKMRDGDAWGVIRKTIRRAFPLDSAYSLVSIIRYALLEAGREALAEDEYPEGLGHRDHNADVDAFGSLDPELAKRGGWTSDAHEASAWQQLSCRSGASARTIRRRKARVILANRHHGRTIGQGGIDGALQSYELEPLVRREIINRIAKDEDINRDSAERRLRRWLADPPRYRRRTERYQPAFDQLLDTRARKMRGE
jgi:hypothetical protein